jgi:hypothetical protein
VGRGRFLFCLRSVVWCAGERVSVIGLSLVFRAWCVGPLQGRGAGARGEGSAGGGFGLPVGEGEGRAEEARSRLLRAALAELRVLSSGVFGAGCRKERAFPSADEASWRERSGAGTAAALPSGAQEQAGMFLRGHFKLPVHRALGCLSLLPVLSVASLLPVVVCHVRLSCVSASLSHIVSYVLPRRSALGARR